MSNLLYVGEGRAECRLLLRQFVSRATRSDHGKVSEGGLVTRGVKRVTLPPRDLTVF